MSTTVAVLGAGYVGLTTSACLAHLGHLVVCADIDEEKVSRLRAGQVDIIEPRLAELIAAGTACGRLEFVVGARAAVRRADIVVLCLHTPSRSDGTADLSAMWSVVAEIRGMLRDRAVVVTKSTVPVGTCAQIEELLGSADVAVVSNPEFLREGSAVHDFLHPDRIVVGSADPEAASQVVAMYDGVSAPLVLTDAASAELIKYASNCFLAVKLSYANAKADLCEQLGADVEAVVVGSDHRSGDTYLTPGPGWGGSCLPKDTNALLSTAEQTGVGLAVLRGALASDTEHRRRIIEKVTAAAGGDLTGVRIGLLGLTFKAGTDDLRDSPALVIARLLAAQGALVSGYDPAVSGPGPVPVETAADPYELASQADLLVLCTEWTEFRELEWQRVGQLLARPVVVDTRNHLDPALLARVGVRVIGTGRRSAGQTTSDRNSTRLPTASNV